MDLVDDLDGDGLGELLLGDGTWTGKGKVLVLSGANATPIYSCEGFVGSGLGYSVAHLGDATGDLVPDFAASYKAGVTTFVWGGQDGGEVCQQDSASASIARLGDLNGDGLEDFVVGKPMTEFGGGGSAQVILGGACPTVHYTVFVLASRPPIAGYDEATPRGYHSVGVLDPSGAVWLIGGRRHVDDPGGGGGSSKPDPEDTAEVYRPPYFFQGTRPGLGGVPSTIQYGLPFCVDSRNPSSLSHASLIGIGAVTHHFDYGQRYVELLIDVDPENPCPQNTPVRILPPPMASMAPPGYYLLFLVDTEGRPSTGKFVLLDN
jgi:hypothetical protein